MLIECLFLAFPSNKVQTVFSFFFFAYSHADLDGNDFIRCLFFLFFILLDLDQTFVLQFELFCIDLEPIQFEKFFIDLALNNFESIQRLYKSLEELNWISSGEELGIRGDSPYFVIGSFQLAPSFKLILFLIILFDSSYFVILFVSSGFVFFR